VISCELKAHFDTFGFVVLRRGFSPEEVARIERDFAEVLAAERGGAPFDGVKRQGVARFIEKRPSLLRLVEDDRIYETVEALLGPGFIFIASEGNLMVGDTTWHPDGYRPDSYPDRWPLALRRVAATFYLDPVGRDTGCLRVIPGSHRPPLYDDLKRLLAYTGHPIYASLKPLADQRADPNEPAFGVPQPQLPCFPIETEPGDVIFWSANLWHASFGGQAGRRMFRITFAEDPVTPEQIGLLRMCYETVMKTRQGAAPGSQADHEPLFLESDRPRIRHLANRLVELGMP
jgi:hypothetical protein